MKKIILSIALIFVFLLICTSCINKNNPSNSDMYNEEKIHENISDNSTQEIFLSNIPYDKSINYITKINGNLVNGSNIADDEKNMYYINIKDENKLYKLDKEGINNQLIYGESIEKLQYSSEKLYFLKSEKSEMLFSSGLPIYNTYICSTNSDGTDYEEILNDKDIKNFLVLNDKIYYIAFSDEYNDEGMERYDLLCFDIATQNKYLVYENVKITNMITSNNPIISNKDNIYFITRNSGVVEYNIESDSIKNILNDSDDYYTLLTDFIICDDKIIFKCKNDRENPIKWSIYIMDITKLDDKPLCIFSEIDSSDMLMSVNITDNYIFFTYTLTEEINSGKSKIIFVRMTHDGSEIVKIKEIYCEKITNISIGEIYIIDDKLIFLNNHTNMMNEKIRIMDFDGNELNWEV